MDRRRQHRYQVHLGTFHLSPIHLGRLSARAWWRGLALCGVLGGWLFAHPAQAANCTVSALESASVFPKISSSHLKSITSSLDFHYDHSRTC